ncbi:MAG TPA: SpoIIE family protein phosphatase [Methanoregula sp.]|nr:SpoIIE family protein phosphatase [Methanoregula sp.]
MDLTILQTFVLLFQMICVVIVFAYLFTRSRFFLEILENHPLLGTQVLLVIIFGALSIYGLSSGISYSGANANIRDLGPIIAGLTCGPYVGLGAGLIGGAYRLTMGGSNVLAAAAGPVIAGFSAGLIWLWNKRRIISTKQAIIFTIIVESFVSALAIIIRIAGGNTSGLTTIIVNVAIPMIVLTTVAVAIFSLIVHNLINEKKTQKEKEQLESEMARKDAELAIAAEIQQSFLPSSIPQIEGFEIAGMNIPAKEVGGDFFDVMPLEVIPLNHRCMGILIADVSGKGVPAALFMALSRIVIRVSATMFPKVSGAVRFANPVISRDAKTGMFVTVFYGVLDNEQHTLSYVNAGHNPPLLFRKNADEPVELEATGMALGVMEDAPYEEGIVSLQAGDILLLYTDGVTDAINDRQQMYDINRLTSTVKENRNRPAREIVESIINSVNEFSQNQPQFDDITLMVIRVL